MTVFSLKTYQAAALDSLRAYLDAARAVGAKPAFEGTDKPGVRTPRPYRPLQGLEKVPYVCLRLPTGGGKTLLSAHTVKIAADTYLEREFPLVLWLVPSNVIRAQTLETLKKPGNPNHEALRAAFDGRFRAFDIADFALITPADLQSQACVIVATMQTLRVGNTEGRKVYAHNENLEPHFTTLATSDGLERIEEGDAKGQIKFSFRNLLALNRPLVIVDEAHNNTSALSYEVLQRVNAACVVEFTATPAGDSNILHNVSATELKAEAMIKLPIRLSEHRSWEEAARDAIQTRKRLEDVAKDDADYIRPIILFQAEEKGREVTKEVLLKHLTEQEEIPRDKIAVVTGDQKELDGINLFARDCPIDFVVTVEALKEGWDCSFAYVFCSVATVNSKKDVEQLLGRVLRMPYATKRTQADLNRAYAHVSRASWPNAVNQLHDRLVDMGFEQGEAEAFVEPLQPRLDLQGGAAAGLFSAAPPPTVLELEEDLSGLELSDEEKASVTIERTEAGSRLILSGALTGTIGPRLAGAARAATLRAKLENAVRSHSAVWAQHLAPSQRGVSFSAPQLCFLFDGAMELAEREVFLDAKGWKLTDHSAELSEDEFRLTESGGVQWEVDLNAAGKITERTVGQAEQYDLDLVDTGWTQGQLRQWLERKARQPDITQPVMLEFVRRALAHLIEKRGLPLTALVRWKFPLMKALGLRIERCRREASAAGYQESLFGPEAVVETSFDYAFAFTPDGYGPHWSYAGHPYQFGKHFYPAVGELNNKGEEYECAKALDRTTKVKHWVRNLERRGLWLPLADGKFYPDFVAELTDGRILIVEHKGEVYASNDDSKEKRSIGELWEAKSGGRALFLMTVVEKGRPALFDQIAAKIG